MEPVTDSTLGKDVSGIFRIWFEFPSELSNDNADVFEISPSVSLPDGLGKILMSERLVGVRDQTLKDQKLFGSKVAHTAAGTFDFVRFQVNRTILKDNLTA